MSATASHKVLPRTPKLCRHKATDQAYVRLNGRCMYLGRHDDPQTQQKYHQLIAQWLSGTLKPAANKGQITVAEIIDRFWQHVISYYVKPDGGATCEQNMFKMALKPLNGLYGHDLAGNFGPLALKTVRAKMIQLGWCRNLVNRMIGRVRQMFRWATENELIEPSIYHGLETVGGSRKVAARSANPSPSSLCPRNW